MVRPARTDGTTREGRAVVWAVLLAAARASLAAEDVPAEWRAEAERTAAAVRSSAVKGAAEGRRETVYVDLAGRSERGKLVAADEEKAVVELPGMRLSLAWEKLSPRRLRYIGTRYAPPGSAKARLALGRYCIVHGLLDEAEEDLGEALSLDPALAGEARRALDLIRALRREKAAESARPAAGAGDAKGGDDVARPTSTPKAPAARTRAPAGWDHPYILLDRKEIPALKGRFARAPYERRWRRLLSKADGHCGSRPSGGGGNIGNSRNSLGVAGTCAFAYVITGERKYADRAKAEALALASAGRWMAHTGVRADLVTGEASTACALVYDWCHDAMSPEERERLKEGLLKLGVGPYVEGLGRDWWVNNRVTNWAGVCHGGGGLAGLALYNESPEAKRAADAAWEHVPAFLRHAVNSDGGGDEGVMYWRYGVEFGLYFFTAAERQFGTDLALYDELANRLAGYWDCYMQGPDGRYANFNDMGEDTFKGLWSAGGGDEAGPSSHLNALFESKVPGGDPLLAWAADSGGANFYWGGVSPFWVLWRRDSPEVRERPRLQDAVLFRGCGHVVWQSPSLWFAYNGGWISDKSHYNRDLGGFVLVAGGERFAWDPGYGKNRTGEHSTVLPGGREQRKGARATYLRYGEGKGFRYLASDMSDCYEGGVSRFVRHAVMVRGEYVVLVDDLAAAEATEFEWRLQTRARIETAPSASGGALLTSGGKGLSIAIASPVGARPEARGGYVSFKTSPLRATVIAAALIPVAGGAAAKADLEVEGGKATLTVTRAGAKADSLVFAQAAGGIVLASVNGESAAKIGPPRDRVIVPFRNRDAR